MTAPVQPKTFPCLGCNHPKERVFANIYVGREVTPVCRPSCMNAALRIKDIMSDNLNCAMVQSVWVEIVGSKTPQSPLSSLSDTFSPLSRSPKMDNLTQFDNDDEQMKELSKHIHKEDKNA